jgi:hypothetical protein
MWSQQPPGYGHVSLDWHDFGQERPGWDSRRSTRTQRQPGAAGAGALPSAIAAAEALEREANRLVERYRAGACSMAECMAALLSLLPQQAMIAAWAISAWLAGLLAILRRQPGDRLSLLQRASLCCKLLVLLGGATCLLRGAGAGAGAGVGAGLLPYLAGDSGGGDEYGNGGGGGSWAEGGTLAYEHSAIQLLGVAPHALPAPWQVLAGPRICQA